jgi:hypothetical protein
MNWSRTIENHKSRSLKEYLVNGDQPYQARYGVMCYRLRLAGMFHPCFFSLSALLLARSLTKVGVRIG